MLGGISIHALRGESDRTHISAAHGAQHFNPRSPRGERRTQQRSRQSASKFQSTLSEGRATADCCCGSAHATFQSTLSEGRATKFGASFQRKRIISIHALRGESDKGTKTRLTISHNFNPRSPRGERRKIWQRIWQTIYFNPRSPRGERQQTYPKCCVAVWIDFLIFEKDAYKIKTKIITKWDF